MYSKIEVSFHETVPLKILILTPWYNVNRRQRNRKTKNTSMGEVDGDEKEV